MISDRGSSFVAGIELHALAVPCFSEKPSFQGGAEVA